MLVRTLVGVVALASLSACTGGGDAGPSPDPSPTPIDELDASGVEIPRTSYCQLVAPAAVERAIGKVASTDHYGNGETAVLTEGVRDVAHEFSCSWSAEDGARARFWIFAPPVTEGQARGLVDGVRRTRGCTLLPQQGFGEPAAGAVCVDQGRTTASWRGLFVDTWLTCEVSRPGDVVDRDRELLVERAGDWCVAVVGAAG